MTSRFLRIAIVVLGASLLTAGLAWAKGPPSQVTIAGPGLESDVEITDPDALEAFSFFQFENLYRKIDAPADPGEGNVITRFVKDGQRLIAWDRVIYYPDIHPGADGKLGAVYLEGLIGDNSTEFDGYWYIATYDGDTAMRQILAENLPAAAPANPLESLAQPAPAALFVTILVGLLGLAAFSVRARTAIRQRG